jgi:hypothetical protein
MNTVPGEVMNKAEHTEVVHEGEKEEGLVEMGAVSETKGGPFGAKFESGFGTQYF